MSVTYKSLGIYEILSLLSNDLAVDYSLLMDTFDENPDRKSIVIDCFYGRVTYDEVLESLKDLF